MPVSDQAHSDDRLMSKYLLMAPATVAYFERAIEFGPALCEERATINRNARRSPLGTKPN